MENTDLSVKLYFDIDNNRLRIQDNTDYLGDQSVSSTNIAGVYKLTDPNGNILHEGIDFNNPDVDPDSSLYSAYVTFTLVEGAYTLVYSAYSSATLETYVKTFTYTYDADDIPDVLVGIESDVALAIIESTDDTTYAANVVLNTRTHTLTWPTGTISTETSTAVDSISLTELWTGEYTGEVEANITITNTDDLVLIVTISGETEHSVWDSDGFYAVRVALDTFYDRWVTAKTSNPKKAREYSEIWNQINSNAAMYNAHKQNGDVENAGEYLDNIKDLLAAQSINTVISPSISVPVSQTLNGYASRWLDGSGVPSVSTGRNGDYYFNTDDNKIYAKALGAWSLVGTLGANAIIQFSANGTTGWTATYANGLNYIRFSGDGGATWTVVSKFIDGYIYFAYASDEIGTGFICTDQAAFVYDSSLEYMSIKKFSQEYIDTLVAGDFDYFTRYKGEGIAVSVNPGTIIIPKDKDDVYSYIDATAQIQLNRAGDDLTTDFTFTKGTETNVTASVSITGLVTITNLTSANGAVQITCSKAGVDNIIVDVIVKEIAEGYDSVTVYCSVPSVAIPTDANGNNQVYPTTNPQIYVIEGNEDVTPTWAMAIYGDSGDITATIVNSDEISITDLVSDNASLLMSCTKSGYDTLYVTVLVYKAKAGQSVVDATSVDNSTIEYDAGTSKIRVKDLGVTTAKIAAGAITYDKLDTDIVDNVTIEIDADGSSSTSSALRVKDSGITSAKIAAKNVTRDKIVDVFANYAGTIADNDATPDVAGKNIWIYGGTANSITLTDLDNPVVGATYTIIGNSDTYIISIASENNFKISGGWKGRLNDSITLLCAADNYYIELSRSTGVSQIEVPFSTWNMDSTANIDVDISAYVTDVRTIRDIRAQIYSDASTLVSKPLHSVSSACVLNGGVGGINNGVVTLYRLTGGEFDSADYSSSTKRGYIIIEFI